MKMLKFISLFIFFSLTGFSLHAADNYLFRDPTSGCIIPIKDNYRKLKNGVYYTDGLLVKNGIVGNAHFRMRLHLYSTAANSIEELVSLLYSESPRLRQPVPPVALEGWKLISLQQSLPDRCWFFQFRKEAEGIKPASRMGLVARREAGRFILFEFSAQESFYISGERPMLRLLETALLPDDSFVTRYSPLVPYLTGSLEDVDPVAWISGLPEADPKFSSRAIFFRIEDEDSAVYLLGSVHSGLAQFFPLPAEVVNAFDSCETLVFEAVPEGNTLWELRNYSRNLEKYRTGENLLNQITPEEFARIEQLVTSKVFSIPRDQLMYQKPWVLYTFVSSMLMQDHEIRSEYGIENYFNRIRKPGVEVKGLEEVKYHLSVLDRISSDYWISELFLLESEREMDELDEMMERWRVGDLDFFDAEVEKDRFEKDPSYYYHMLEDRNEVMADSIEEYLAMDSDHFIIAGTAHFAGDHSLQRLLRERGLNVERLLHRNQTAPSSGLLPSFGTAPLPKPE